MDTAARIVNLALPGQVLLSIGAFKSAKAIFRTDDAGQPVKWRVYGEYALKGIEEPVRVGEVGIEEMSPLTAPRSPAIDGRGLRRGPLILLALFVLAAGVLVPIVRRGRPEPLRASVAMIDKWGLAGFDVVPRPPRPGPDHHLNLYLNADRPGSFYTFQTRPNGSTIFQPPDAEDRSGACAAMPHDPQPDPRLFGSYELDDPPGPYCFVTFLTDRSVEGFCDHVQRRLPPIQGVDDVRSRVREFIDAGAFKDRVLGFATFEYTIYSE